jgi:hypothetical protein
LPRWLIERGSWPRRCSSRSACPWSFRPRIGRGAPWRKLPDGVAGASSSAVCGEGTSQSGGSGRGGGASTSAASCRSSRRARRCDDRPHCRLVVLRRRTSMPVAPLDTEEWWTCAKCGKNNVIDSPRCYACGSWRT